MAVGLTPAGMAALTGTSMGEPAAGGFPVPPLDLPRYHGTPGP
ncbi:hypothetical protein AB0L05_06710 [Nonomuraea pusilla]